MPAQDKDRPTNGAHMAAIFDQLVATLPGCMQNAKKPAFTFQQVL